jgi:sterol desaturase/sphingolipid hydroxylase (fatty acid hydroxylase superfamily)
MFEYLAHHGQVFLIDVFRLCVWLALLSVIFVPLERLFALHPRKIFRPGIVSDLGYFFVGGVVPAMLLSFPTGLAAWSAHRFIPHGLHVAVAETPFWARFLAGLVVGDIGYYWAHRCLHGIPILWRFHAVHHSAQEIDFLVNTRAHPVDITFSRLGGIVPLYILGLAGPSGAAGSLIPALVVVVGTTWSFFIHANLRWRLRALEWVISTPHFHHWHHTTDAPVSRNYAAMLPVLDRLFGTHNAPKGLWPAGYGIQEAMPTSFVQQLVQPFFERWPSGAVPATASPLTVPISGSLAGPGPADPPLTPSAS